MNGRLIHRLGRVVRVISAAPLAVALGLLLASPARAVDGAQEITSDGPLTRIIVSAELHCQVAHRDDTSLELFGGEIGACGTFLATGGALYGPSFMPSGVSPTAAWTVVSQTLPAGSGSAADPFRIVTVVDATDANLSVEQTDSYVVGSQAYRTDVRISNVGAEARNGILYRAGDCYLQESDSGFGRVDGGAPACVTAREEGSRIEQWRPITAGSRYFEGGFSEVWNIIGSQEPFPNTCACDQDIDNGAGLSWAVTIQPGQSVVVSHETFFSPVGLTPVHEPFRESVPDPTKISLDPVVIAQSAAVAAAVILLIPFPSALFNSTLEQHYDEVMAGVARIRAWLAALGGAFVRWIRRQIAARRAPPAEIGPPVDVPVGAPAEVPVVAPLDAAAPAGGGPQPAGSPPAPSPATTVREGEPASDLWRTPRGMVLFVLVSAVLYAFLDPTFGFSAESLATLAGLAVGLTVITLAHGIPLTLFARSRGIRLVVRALPATLVVGVGCVLLSRLADFQPGYLYGLVIGFLFTRDVAAEHEGRAQALGAAVVLGVALVSWVGLAFLRASGEPPDLALAAVETAMVTVLVAGLEHAIFGMLPLRFLPGSAVFDWDRRIWAAIVAVGVFAFAHILLNPTSGYLADDTRTSFFTLVALLAFFGIVSALFWAWFRFRPRRATA